MESLRIGESLWSIALGPDFESDEMEGLMKTIGVEWEEVTTNPNADMWHFTFKQEEFILVYDLDYGLDIRFFKKESEDLAKQIIKQWIGRNNR